MNDDRQPGSWPLFIAVMFITVALDQLTKWIITRELGPNGSRGSIEIVSDFVTLDYARNDGVAFGFLQGGSWVVWVAVSAGLVIGGLFVASTVIGASRWMIVALALCAGGATGNLIDRISRGFVVDFIEIGRWPAFNVADSALTIGLMMVVAQQILNLDRDAAVT